MLNIPRVMIAGLCGGSGKTIVSLGVGRAWAQVGRRIKPFKKGPDYIDARWLSLAARAPATNLDPFLLPSRVLRALFQTAAAGFSGALIEGNRGLFDGKDVMGSCSTAEVSRMLAVPVVLVMDCAKMTRTAAALVKGMACFEDGVHIAGVLLNNTAGDRHRAILRAAIEEYTDVPVLGALPRMAENPIPERHMGLWSDAEMTDRYGSLDTVATLLQEHADIDHIWDIACAAPAWPVAEDVWSLMPQGTGQGPVRIGYVRDRALWFYYEENIEALQRAGACMVELSLLDDAPWPCLDGLYLGGGFPETCARQLADNVVVRERVRTLAAQNMPIYAECGGLMYLGRTLCCQGHEYPMAGVFPIATSVHKRPQGLGYVEATVTQDTPFHAEGTTVRGHEFHYSQAHVLGGESVRHVLQVRRGQGMGDQVDGLLAGNTFASYTHLFALGETYWAENFVKAARCFRAAAIADL